MIELKLNPKIYNEEAVKVAIKDYASFCRIGFKKRGDFLSLSFAGNDGAIQGEFLNYVLAQIVRNK